MPAADIAFSQLLIERIEADRGLERGLEARFEELGVQLAAIRERRAAAERLYEVEFGQLPEPGAHAAADQVSKPLGPFSGLPWAVAISQVLIEASEPDLHVRDIWERLKAGGFQTYARDPLRSVVAVAVRDPKLTRVAPNRYALIGHGDQRRTE